LGTGLPAAGHPERPSLTESKLSFPDMSNKTRFARCWHNIWLAAWWPVVAEWRSRTWCRNGGFDNARANWLDAWSHSWEEFRGRGGVGHLLRARDLVRLCQGPARDCYIRRSAKPAKRRRRF